MHQRQRAIRGALGNGADKFVEQFGLRAFRRPLSMAEVNRLTALYKSQRTADIGSSFEQSIAQKLVKKAGANVA